MAWQNGLMPRNQPFALNRDQRLAAMRARTAIEAKCANPDADAHMLEVEFVKRDGTLRILSGRVEEIAGTGSAEHVKIVTSNGIRSANLWAIKSVSDY